MSARSAVSKIDFTKLFSILTPETATSLQVYRKKYEDLSRLHYTLSQQTHEQEKALDFGKYRSVLKNKDFVDKAEKAWTSYRPQAMDLRGKLALISKFEDKALAKAEQTVVEVNKELSSLQQALSDIKDARPIEHLTCDDVVRAAPEIEKEVERMVKNYEWEVPGYQDKFGPMKALG